MPLPGRGTLVRWRKSSYSGYNGNCVEVAWRKSSHSNGHSTCTEVAVVPTSGGQDGCAYVVAVRDSKDPAGPVLTFSPSEWLEFASRLKAAA